MIPLALHTRSKHSAASADVSRETLFADAEVPKDDVEEILDINTARDPSDRSRCEPKIFGNQFRSRSLACSVQRLYRLPQRLAVPRPGHNRRLARPLKTIFCCSSNSFDQLRQPLPGPEGEAQSPL